VAKKTVKCEAWLTYILNEVLPKTKQSATDKILLTNRSINLIDGSCVKQEGVKGEVIRIHMNYSLSNRRMDETIVTDNHTAESFKLFNIIPGNIYIADAGYGKGKNFEYITSHQGDAILRITPDNVSFAKDPSGKEKIDMSAELNISKDIFELHCHIHTENKRYIPVRVIASRLPEDKIAETIKRKKRKAQQNRTAIKETTLIYAQWTIIITSLDDNNSASDILKLYRTRWQVELLFKRIKQFFNITRVKAATVQHSKVLILIWLIAWALIEREVVAAETCLTQNHIDMSLYSYWSMSGYFFHNFKMLINCLLSLCLDDIDIINVYKHLRNHKTKRINKFAAACFP